MNKKEIAEIKKLFTPSHCAITRICGCYVDAEKNVKTKLKEAFLSLEEEEMFKYFKIFKSTSRNIVCAVDQNNIVVFRIEIICHDFFIKRIDQRIVL